MSSFTPYSTPDLVERILGGKRGNEIRRLGGRGIEVDRIILAELRYIAAAIPRTDIPAEQRRVDRLAAHLCSSYTFAPVSARIRAALRDETAQLSRGNL
jgi:hypothetical protein